MSTTAADRGREARRRLLAAAAELIAERGWAAVSTRMLAERAGVAPGVVHYHFASVQALLTEAALAVMHDLIEQAGAGLAHARTPGEALGLMMEFLAAYDGRDPTSLLFAEAYLAAGRDEDLRRSLGGVVAEFRRALAGRLAEHRVPAPDATAAVIAAAIDGIMLHRALGPGPDAADLTAVLRRLVAPAEPRPSTKEQ
ncbi:TetR family transcriptional regulator [Actinoallomurus sp. NBC_01490]|uniref:TetR/AcrR family transcriptional regulator n=1 Tax=Actinoallomurus sp. NBC_01490 TaxID=2903557 RepID=UPI002E305B48|nr:TetR family transcriptional regulator [Actinoallomurus sp. NBC_01490]